MYVYIYVYMSIYICICLYIYVYVYVYVNVNMYMCMCMYMDMDMSTYFHILMSVAKLALKTYVVSKCRNASAGGSETSVGMDFHKTSASNPYVSPLLTLKTSRLSHRG